MTNNRDIILIILHSFFQKAMYVDSYVWYSSIFLTKQVRIIYTDIKGMYLQKYSVLVADPRIFN